jgi:putative sigma-54 modulation protein
MRIEVKGRDLAVTEAMRAEVARRFEKVAKQVSEQAVLEVELCKEPNPAKSERCVAVATLRLKGTTLRAREASPDLKHSVHLVADELVVQVKRHRDKRRNRREGRVAEPSPLVLPTIADGPAEGLRGAPGM